MGKIFKYAIPVSIALLIGMQFARKKVAAVREADITEINPLAPQGHTHKLVMFYGKPSTPDLVADKVYLKPFPVQPLFLKRNVEYYQWIDVSTRDYSRTDTGTTTTMRKRDEARLAWAPPKTPYRSLLKENPVFTIEEYTKSAYSVRFGKVWVHGTLWRSLQAKELELNTSMLAAGAKGMTLIRNKLYSNANGEENPQLGDVRIWYTVIMPDEATAAGILNAKNELYAWPDGEQHDIGGAIIPGHASKRELISREFQKDGWIWD